MLTCFPMRMDAESAGVLTDAQAAYPAPEVSSLAGLEPPVRNGVSWPGPVEKLAADGSGLGWRARKQWARGCLPHATTGAPGAAWDSYVVRFARADASLSWGAWALYRQGAWKSVWMWGTALLPFGLAGVTDLRVWLAGPAACGVEWFDVIRKRVADQETARKAATAARPRARREGMS